MVSGIVSLTEPCESCQRVPTGLFRFRSNSGFLFRRWSHSYEGMLCRICARGAFRDMQAHNLTMGWWGFASFVGTIVYLIDNREALRRGTAGLKRPLPADPRKDARLVGRPVFSRPPVLLVLGTIALVVTGIVTNGFGIDRDPWDVGACVTFSETNVIVVPCDDPSSEGSVLAIIEDVFACPEKALYFVELNAEEVACLG